MIQFQTRIFIVETVSYLDDVDWRSNAVWCGCTYSTGKKVPPSSWTCSLEEGKKRQKDCRSHCGYDCLILGCILSLMCSGWLASKVGSSSPVDRALLWLQSPFTTISGNPFTPLSPSFEAPNAMILDTFDFLIKNWAGPWYWRKLNDSAVGIVAKTIKVKIESTCFEFPIFVIFWKTG